MSRFFGPTLVATVVISAAAMTAEGADPKPIAEFPRPRHPISKLEFSGDGRFLAVVETEPPRERGLFDIFSTGSCDDDGFGFGLISTGGSFRVWDVERRKSVISISSPNVGYAFSPDGTMLVTADIYSLADRSENLLWDLTKNPPARKRRLTSEPAEGSEGGVTIESDAVMAFSPDGKLLATARAGARLWRTDLAEAPHVLLDTSYKCDYLFFDRKGERLIVVCSKRQRDETILLQVALFDVAAPQKPKKLVKIKDLIDPRFSDDESAVEYITCHIDPKNSSLIICERKSIDLATLRETTLEEKAISLRDPPFDLWTQPEPTGLHNDGVRLKVTAKENKIRLARAVDGRVVGEFAGDAEPITRHTWSPDGKRLATVGAKIRVWDVDSLPIPAEPLPIMRDP